MNRNIFSWRYSAVLLISIGVLSCKSAKLSQVTEADANRAADRFPANNLTTLTEAQELYKTTCNRCHPLKNPARHTEKKWNRVLPRMTKRAGLDSAEKAKIYMYVLTMSKGSKK